MWRLDLSSSWISITVLKSCEFSPESGYFSARSNAGPQNRIPSNSKEARGAAARVGVRLNISHPVTTPAHTREPQIAPGGNTGLDSRTSRNGSVQQSAADAASQKYDIRWPIAPQTSPMIAPAKQK